MAEKFDAMVCTVGENPLPVYLGIAQLTKPDATIVLLHSEGTEGEAKRIANCLGTGRKVLMGKANGCLIKNPWDFESVFTTISYWADVFKDNSDAAINITGGTNVMTGFGMTIWIGRDNNNVVYLEEKENKFHIGDGRTEKLHEEISIELLRKLHGVELNIEKKSMYPESYDEASRHLYRLFQKRKLGGLNDDNLNIRNKRNNGSPLYDWIIGGNFQAIWNTISDGVPCWGEMPGLPKSWEDFVANPNTGDLHELGKRVLFANGFWMENLVFQAFEKAVDGSSIIEGQEFMIDNQPFELDLLTVKDNRFYVVSVTTQMKQKNVKGKSFEVIHRARQVGGSLARSIVVSPLFEEERDECQVSVDPSDKPRHLVIAAPVKYRNQEVPVDNWVRDLSKQFRDFFDDQG